MKRIYLFLSIVGFIAPNVFVAMESIESGNIMLWLHPLATMDAMFANKVATAFVVDLLVVVLVFFVWSYREARKYRVRNIGLIWVVTLLFGLSGAFPLFLYLREVKKSTI